MILIFYHLSIILLGCYLQKKFFHALESRLLRGTVSIIVGIFISLPVTYILAVVFQRVDDPIQWAVWVFTIVVFVGLLKRKAIPIHLVALRKGIFSVRSTVSVIDLLVIFLSFLFAWVVMEKTFTVAMDGTFLVARNTVFDFGHMLSIIRSMSWGANIPYLSPFVSGTPHLYHFMFHFWCALLERFGLPIFFAVNIPSAVGFGLLVVTVYIWGKEIFRNRYTGILAIIFLIFHPGLSFIPFFEKYDLSLTSVWKNPNYLFAGPFDGSVYSLFFTLNVFVNQRHLGISLAIFFIIFLLFIQEQSEKKWNNLRVVLYATLVGIFSLWHLTLTVGLIFIFCVALLGKRRWSALCIFLGISCFTSGIFIYSWIPSLFRGIVHLPFLFTKPLGAEMQPSGFLWFFPFVFFNFGLTIFFFLFGIIRERKIIFSMLPLFLLVLLFVFVSIPTGIIDQKYLNVLLVLVAMFSAHGFVLLWNESRVGKYMLVATLPFLILSGIIDGMVIKNDFLFPVSITSKNNVVSWIRDNTPSDAVFVSYQDIFDPVTLAGRKNYYGFFKQPDFLLKVADNGRSEIVRRIFESTNGQEFSQALKGVHVQYLMVPLDKRNDFSYSISVDRLRKIFPVVYEDKKLLIVDIRTGKDL